jgi:hypothetical protein
MLELGLDHPDLTIHGAFDYDRSDAGLTPRRLPDWTRPQVPVFMEMMVTQPSGVRIEFMTDSNVIELDALPTRIQIGDREPRPAVFDLVCDGQLQASVEANTGNVLAVDLTRPGHPELVKGEASTLRFDGLSSAMKRCEIWLPSSAQVALGQLRVAPDAAVASVEADTRPRWVHHGSSISHCAEATSPTQTWPATAARLAGASLTNLAFGGNCQLDQFVARTIRDLDADLISLKLGINIVNMDSMRERTFTPAVHGFLDTVRERHADTPILIVSPIYCPSAETQAGPTIPNADGKFVTYPGEPALRAGCLTLTWIRKILAKVVSQRREAGDDNLHYLDGLELFGEGDVADLPDDLHPNGAGYVRMGERFHALAFANGGPFAR